MLASFRSAVSALDSGLHRLGQRVAVGGSSDEAPGPDAAVAAAEHSRHTILETATLVASTEEPTEAEKSPSLQAAEAAGVVSLKAGSDPDRVSVELTPIGEYLAASEKESNPPAPERGGRARRGRAR